MTSTDDDRRGFYATLGEGSDCENCGWSSEGIGGEVSDNGEVHLYVQFGCFHGDSYYGPAAQVRRRLVRDYQPARRELFDNPKAFDEALHWLAWIDG